MLCITDVVRSGGKALKIECKNISSTQWKFMNRKYITCRDWPIFMVVDKPDMEISEVLHQDGSEVTNLYRIEVLWIEFAQMYFMPNGIKMKFLNLKAIKISKCFLKYLNRKNMRQFGSDLEHAIFNDNQISILGADLFQFNPNLKEINFDMNPLKFIDPGFFENIKILQHIKYVSFLNSQCIDQGFTLDEHGDIQSYIWNDENCRNSTERDSNLKLQSEM